MPIPSPTEQDKAQEIRTTVLEMLETRFKDVPADLMLAVLISLTVDLALMLSTSDNPKKALLLAVERVAIFSEQQQGPSTIQ